MQPIYVSKLLGAFSSNGIGSISTASPSVVTLNTSNLDTGRRIVFTSTADASSLTLTFTGKGEQRTASFSEAVKGSTASGVNATTTSDFISLSSVGVSSNANVPILIGTSSVGGTQWKLTNWHVTALAVGAALTFSSTAAAATGSIEFTMDDPTQTYPNPSSAAVPAVFTSTSHVSTPASTNSWGIVNSDANSITPIAAWRLTVTSTSTSATVAATVMQGDIG